MFLDYVAGKLCEDPFVLELEEAVSEARRNREWRHEYMTLMLRDQDNIEKGREEGREEGLQQGIIALVSTLKDLDVKDEIILRKLREKFELTLEQAQTYI